MAVRVAAGPHIRRSPVVMDEQVLLRLWILVRICPSVRELRPRARLFAQLAALENLAEILLDVSLRHARIGPYVDQDVVSRGRRGDVCAVEVNIRRARAMEAVRVLVLEGIPVRIRSAILGEGRALVAADPLFT